MLFQIKKASIPTEKIGGATVHNTGESSYYKMTVQLFKTEIDATKNHFKFRTGFDSDEILTNTFIPVDDRPILEKKAKELRKFVLAKYPEAKEADKKSFWIEDRTQLTLSYQDSLTVHDTETEEGALLYLNILGGGYPMIGITKEAADIKGLEYYVIEVSEQNEKDLKDTYGNKLEAMAELHNLCENKSVDALMWISYLTSETNKGRTRSTSRALFQKDFMDYIEGAQSDRDKKQAAKTFYKYAKLWNTDKEAVILEASVKAALYYGLIVKDNATKKLYIKNTGFDLGGSEELAVKKLSMFEHQEELKNLTKELNTFLVA